MDGALSSRDPWMPGVAEDVEGTAILRVVGGADALHQPREFSLPLRPEHLPPLRDSLQRHLLLHSALRPLCHEAGVDGPWDEEAAAALLDPVLLGTWPEVDAFLRGVRVDRRVLIAHHASLRLLDRREYTRSVLSATGTADWGRVRRLMGV